jgi:hypothetical protein
VVTEFNEIFLGTQPCQDAKVHTAGYLRKFHWTVVYLMWWQFIHCYINLKFVEKNIFSHPLPHLTHHFILAALAYTEVMSTKYNYDGHGKSKLMTLLRHVPCTEGNYYHSFLTNTRHKMTNSKHSCSLYKHLSTHHAFRLTSKVPLI